MTARRLWLNLLLSVMFLVTLAPLSATAQQSQKEPADLWADFNHYVLIARPDLAASAGQALLNTKGDVLLDVVEASEYTDYDKTLLRAAKMERVSSIAKQLERAIQEARIERSRDTERIQRDIEQLAQGQRPFRNAVERLSAAGQYSVPQLLATLEDPKQERLHPYVVSALTLIGRPAVYPLAEALPAIENAVVVSQVALVLGQIGYPQALPYLKEVLEAPSTDPDAARVAQKAFDQIRENAGISGQMTAAELYLALATTQYRATTKGEVLPGYDADQGKGIVWSYSTLVGLTAIPVPGEIYGDVLAMRASKRALELNPNLDLALSQYLMANLRRDNRLPASEQDPSYGGEMRAPQFYAMLAGPSRQQDVLAQALTDHDADLALDAIAALADTAGTAALVSQGDARQPLLQALSYPDRRVRFRAAEALANALPDEPFAGSFKVVPVLAAAVRQSGTRYALVIAEDQEQLNETLALAGDLGYEAFGGLSLGDAATEITTRPGVDLIIVRANASTIDQVYRETVNSPYLGATPVLAVITPGQQLPLRNLLGQEARVKPAVVSDDPEALRSAAEQAVQAYAGDEISDQEAEDMALTALQVLRDVTLASNVYRIKDALPALRQALSDSRPLVVEDSGRVLAMIDDATAQKALADAALAESGDLQIALLDSLAQSATAFGNKLDKSQTDELLQLVQQSSGDTALAAARAHGALALPTANAVQMIVANSEK